MAPDDVTILLQRFDSHEEVDKVRFNEVNTRLKTIEVQQRNTEEATGVIARAADTAVALAAKAAADAVVLKDAAQVQAQDKAIEAAEHRGAALEREAALSRVRNIDKFFGSNILKLLILLAIGTDIIAQLTGR